ncbi:MAG: hypothetical protein IIA27_15150 [Gemmatimonadetes bacterium]|nr:hypothetical protein [Gemmatimonadota bacterium]
MNEDSGSTRRGLAKLNAELSAGDGVVVRKQRLVGILGTVGTLFALVSLVTGLVVSLERPWTRIAVRVAGSWIVAVGLLYLGWTFGTRG